MKIKDRFDLYSGTEVEYRGIMILDDDGNEAFEITLKDGKLLVSGMTNLRTKTRGTMVVRPVAANVVTIARE